MVKINRVILRVAVVVTAIVGLLNLADGIYAGVAVDAATSGLTMAATIEPSMTLTLSDSSKILNIIPNSSGSFNSTSITVGAYSNGMIGYTLTMTPDHTDLTGSGTNSIPTLSAASTCTGGSTCSSSNFSAGYWGIAVNDGTYGPAATTDLVTVQTSDPSVASNEFTIYLGANLDLSIPTDNYSTTLNFALVSSTVATYDVTFEYDSGISSLAVQDVSGTTLTPTTSSAGTATYALDYANTYTLVPTYASSYRFQAATLTGDGFFNDANLTYTVGSSNSTVELASFLTYMQDFASLTSSEKTAILASMAEDTQYRLIDNRDGKTYWVSKLQDGNVWMTQNLDLLIGGTYNDAPIVLTSENTDLNKYDTNGDGTGTTFTDYAYSDNVVTWTPTLGNTNATVTDSPATISASGGTAITGWIDSANAPYMMDAEDIYSYQGTRYESLLLCENAGYTESECAHYGVGNYYNFSAATAMSDTSSYTTDYMIMPNSICPAGWRLPNGLTDDGGTVMQSDFNALLTAYNISGGTDTTGGASVGWGTDGFTNIGLAPVSFALSGNISGTSLNDFGTDGFYWSSTVQDESYAYGLSYNSTDLYPANLVNRGNGRSVRCMLR